jgi:isoleucyl-tRNA synthetase
MEPWPSPGGAADPALSEDMALLRELASLGLSARATVGVKVRQPLRAAEVMLADPARAERLAALVPLLVDELNVREVHFGAEAARFVDFKVKPNYPNLGKRLGKEMKTCAAALSAADPAAVRAGLLAGGFTLTLDSGPVTLSEEDVVVEVAPRAGFKAAGSAAAVVALHADLDDDLREEGLSRELINRIAGARKDLDLGYTDRIRVGLRCGAAVRAAARRFEARIRSETLAVALDLVDDEQAPADLDGHPFSMTVEKA